MSISPATMTRLLEEAATLLEQTRRTLTEAGGFQVTAVSLEGAPSHEIIRYAEREQADLIVLGTHGRSGLKRLLLGSVAEHVVRKAPCAVLTVRGT